jgi:hypothetical protein
MSFVVSARVVSIVLFFVTRRCTILGLTWMPEWGSTVFVVGFGLRVVLYSAERSCIVFVWYCIGSIFGHINKLVSILPCLKIFL